MSRAFVDEDSGSDEADDLHEVPLPLPPGAKNYMTSEGALALADELRSLTEVERPKAEALLAAAPPADSAEHIRRISHIDRRISYLARMKSALEVVGLPESLERVVFGLSVRVRDEGSGEEKSYRIVGVDESDPGRGLLSWASPVARSLVGKRVGELAVARLPKGECRMSILGIDRAGAVVDATGDAKGDAKGDARG